MLPRLLLRGAPSVSKMSHWDTEGARHMTLHPGMYAENTPVHVKSFFPAFGVATASVLLYMAAERSCFLIRKLWVEGTLWRLPPGCYHVSEREEWFRRHNAGIPPTSMQAIPGFTITPPPLSVRMKLPGDADADAPSTDSHHHA